MSIVTCPSREELSAYVLGRLSEEALETVASHLEGCTQCAAALADVDDSDDTLVAQLRGGPAASPFLEEPQCQVAVARARQLKPKQPSTGQAGPSLCGQTLGEYQLLEELGRGGMGTVYKALHTKLDRVVALKVLTLGRTQDPRAIARFEREMKAVGKLDHRHIVRAHDAREIDGMPMLVMEYIEGLDLGEILRRTGPLGVPEACELARQTAVGLQYVHKHGLVHRDIKPSNVMLPPQGEVKILDLGLARFHFDQVLDTESSASGPTVAAEVTATDQAMGTIDYMAPEQVANCRTVDIRADLYSLGCTLYKLLTGQAPLDDSQHRKLQEKLERRANEPIIPIDRLRPDIPQELAAVVDRLLAPAPADRFATPAEAAAALAPWCAGADLGALLQQAAGEPVPAAPLDPQVQTRASAVKPRPWAGRSGRKRILAAAIALSLFGGLGVAFGIIIHLKKDNKTTSIEVPEGTTARVDAQGAVTLELPSAPQSAVSLPYQQMPAPYSPPGVVPPVAPPPYGSYVPPMPRYPLSVPNRELDGQWNVVRIEKGKDADAAWAAISGSPAPPLATVYRLFIDDSDEPNELSFVPRSPFDQPPDKNLPATFVLGPFKVQTFSFRKNPGPSRKTIDLHDLHFDGNALKYSVGKLAALGIYELEGDHLQMCLRAATQGHGNRPKSLQVPPESSDILFVLDRYHPSADENAFRHRWTVVEQTKNGKFMPPEPLHTLSWYVDEGVIYVLQDWQPPWSNSRPAGEMGRPFDFVDAKFVLIPTTQPKRLTLFPFEVTDAEGKKNGERLIRWAQPFYGIYRFEGDRLRIAYRKGQPPEKFESPPGSNVTLLLLVMVPSAAPVPALPPAGWVPVPVTPYSVLPPGPRASGIPSPYTPKRAPYTAPLVPSNGPLPPMPYSPGPAVGSAPAVGNYYPGASRPPRQIKSDPLHDQWKVVRIEKGEDADAAWAKIYGSPAPPLATLDRFVIGDTPDESTALFPLFRAPLGQPPNKSLPAPYVFGPFKVRVFCFLNEPRSWPTKIDLYAYRPALKNSFGYLAGTGIYEIDGDHLKLCLRAAAPENRSRPTSFQIQPKSSDILFVLERYRLSEDEKALEHGWWTVAEEIRNGRPTPPERLHSLQIDFDLDSISCTNAPGTASGNWAFKQELTEPLKSLDFSTARFVLDERARPKRMTLYPCRATDAEDNDNGERFLRWGEPYYGIYQLEGDRLRLAFRKGKPPEKFESPAGSGVTLLVLQNAANAAALPGSTGAASGLAPPWRYATPPPPGPAATDNSRPVPTPLTPPMPSPFAPSAVPYGAPTATGSDPAAQVLPIQKTPLHDLWDMVRLEKGKDADTAWTKIYGWAAPPLATIDGFFISPADDEEGPAGNWLFLVSRPPLGEPPNKSLSAPFLFGPFKQRTLWLPNDTSDWPKKIDLHTFNPALKSSASPLTARGIYELDGDCLKICLRADIPQPENRPKSLQIPPEPGDILFVLLRHHASEDEVALNHRWAVVEQIRNGKPTPPEQLRALRYFLDLGGGTVHAHFSVASSDSIAKQLMTDASKLIDFIEARVVLQEAALPKRLTLFPYLDSRADDEKGARVLQWAEPLYGIYQFEGDRLRIAYRKGRPPETFQSPPGSDVVVLLLQRAERDPVRGGQKALTPALPSLPAPLATPLPPPGAVSMPDASGRSGRKALVHVQLRIIQLDRAKLRKTGFDLSRYLPDTLAKVASADGAVDSNTHGAPSDALHIAILDQGNHFFDVLKTLQDEKLATVLGQSALVTAADEAGSCSFTGKCSVTCRNTDGTVAVAYKEFGTQVRFIPRLEPGNRMRLEINVQVSGPDPGGEGITSRELETGVEIDLGQTLAIYGMLQAQMLRAQPTTDPSPAKGGPKTPDTSRSSAHAGGDETEILVLATPLSVERPLSSVAPSATTLPAPGIPSPYTPSTTPYTAPPVLSGSSLPPPPMPYVNGRADALVTITAKDGQVVLTAPGRQITTEQIEIFLDRKKSKAEIQAPALEFRILVNHHDHEPIIRRAFRDLAGNEILDPAGKRLAWWVPVKPGREAEVGHDPEIVVRLRKERGRDVHDVLVANDRYNVTGKYLARATAAKDNNGRPCIEFALDEKGGNLFSRLTGDNLPDRTTGSARRLGILVAGELYSAPRIASIIRDRGEITGSFTEKEAKEVADLLNASRPQGASLDKTPNAMRTESLQNLKQLALAMRKYLEDKGRIPPAVLFGPDGKTPYSWRVALLPYLQHSDLYERYRFTEPWDSPNNCRVLEEMPAVFRCPGSPADSHNAAYFALVGPDTIFSGKEGTALADITDGTSTTLLLVEAKRDIPWTKPEDITYDARKPLPQLGGCVADGFCAAMADFTVRVLPSAIPEKLLRALITKAGGELVENKDLPPAE